MSLARLNTASMAPGLEAVNTPEVPRLNFVRMVARAIPSGPVGTVTNPFGVAQQSSSSRYTPSTGDWVVKVTGTPGAGCPASSRATTPISLGNTHDRHVTCGVVPGSGVRVRAGESGDNSDANANAAAALRRLMGSP